MPEAHEVIRQPLYHWKDAPKNGFFKMSFFDSAIGLQGDSDHDTNLFFPNRLPREQRFVIESLQVAVAVDGVLSAANNVLAFKLGRFEIIIGAKLYGSYAPIGFFPYFSEDIKPLDELGHFSDIEPVSPVPYSFGPCNLVLEPEQNFMVSLSWKKPVRINAITRIGVILDGQLYRPVV
jgi:hypothetical protein